MYVQIILEASPGQKTLALSIWRLCRLYVTLPVYWEKRPLSKGTLLFYPLTVMSSVLCNIMWIVMGEQMTGEGTAAGDAKRTKLGEEGRKKGDMRKEKRFRDDS